MLLVREAVFRGKLYDQIRVTAMIAAVGVLVGCSGNVYTEPNPDLSASRIEGVIVYPQINVMEVYRTTLYADPSSGNVIGKAKAGDCTPAVAPKFSVRTDYGNPRIINYDAGLLETNSFAVTLKDGVLASVNTTSDPTAGFTALSGGAASVLPFIIPPHAPAGLDIDKTKPLCNAGPELVGIFEAPPIQPLENAPQILR